LEMIPGGATKLHHLEDAIASLSVQLTADEIERLDAPCRPHPVIAHL
jgi:aryl-alcohol dehydrogenase-like predicted oxidoreductase